MPQFIGDVFGLNTVYENQIQNVEKGNFSYWNESATYGYYGCGVIPTPTIINTISRLDFSNETVSDPGKNLPAARSYLSATSSSSYGYFGGGFSPSFISTISRLDFSNETVSNPGKNLPTARRDLATVSNSN